jgi:adenylate cyclase
MSKLLAEQRGGTGRVTRAELRRWLAAILAADAAGYSRLMGADERSTVVALDAARAVFRQRIESNQGRVIDMAGDSVLAVFETAAGATSAALAIQNELEEISKDVPEDRRLRYRIGLHLGDVIEKVDGTVYGDGVNIAARLQGIAEVGGICISSAVFDAADRHLRLRFEPLGEQRIKNIDRPIRAYRWAAEGRPAVAAEAPDSTFSRDRPAIAVLPFDNMSGDREQDYFSDGITEDIITELSRIPALLVIARNSTFTYKGKAVKVQDVCRDLGVRYVLEGSVRKSGSRIRVTAQLIDGGSGGHLWAERYDRELADVFAVQDDVTEQIVRALEIRLSDAHRAPPYRLESGNPEAYDCVLRGREQYRLFSKEGNAAARRLYERAIELDPSYAEAYAGLAETHWHEWFLGSAEGLDRAFELAQTAKRLDANLPLVYEALSSVHLFKRQHDEAVAAAERWVEIEPGDAEAYANLAGILHFAGEPERVGGLIEKAKRRNPFHPFYYDLYLGQASFTMHRFEEAARAIERSIAQNPESLPSHAYLAACYAQLGDEARARDALAEARRISPDFSVARLEAIAAYRRAADLELLIEGLHKAGLSGS